MEFHTTLNGMTMPVLVLWQLPVTNKDDLFAIVFQELHQRAWVHSSYLEAVKQRELEYPTGLDFGDFAVAVPHIDMEHVIQSALVMVSLQQPVVFQAMDDPEQALPCRLAIFPVLSGTKDQVIFLGAVTTALQKPGFYTAIIEQTSPEGAITFVDRMFADYAVEEEANP